MRRISAVHGFRHCSHLSDWLHVTGRLTQSHSWTHGLRRHTVCAKDSEKLKSVLGTVSNAVGRPGMIRPPACGLLGGGPAPRCPFTVSLATCNRVLLQSRAREAEGKAGLAQGSVRPTCSEGGRPGGKLMSSVPEGHRDGPQPARCYPVCKAVLRGPWRGPLQSPCRSGTGHGPSCFPASPSPSKGSASVSEIFHDPLRLPWGLKSYLS